MYFVVRALSVVLICGLWASGANAHDAGLADVTGHLPDLRFSLLSDDDKARTEKDYRGEIVLLYFGYTHCKDECPLMMSRLGAFLRRLDKNTYHTHVLFVSVDPKRDTPQVLHDYLAAFDPQSMTGLTGAKNDIGALSKRYRTIWRPGEDDIEDIPHSDVAYIFDQAGHARALLTPDNSDDDLMNELRRIAHAD